MYTIVHSGQPEYSDDPGETVVLEVSVYEQEQAVNGLKSRKIIQTECPDSIADKFKSLF